MLGGLNNILLYRVETYMLLIVNNAIKNEDLTPISKYVAWNSQSCGYFLMEAGIEHYKMLSYLSKQFPTGTVLCDIGTYRGCSAAALTANPLIKVVTYDIENHHPSNTLTILDHPQVELRLKDCLVEPELTNIANMPFIFLDISPHDGIQEKNIINALHNKGFQGIMLLDDIYLNDEMKLFWENDIPAGIKKIDLTKYGHASGTGALVFNESKYDIIIL